MRSEDRDMARRQLDKRLNKIRDSDAFIRPPPGWIKAIREALGMPTAQLARRIGVSQPRVVVIERAEKEGSLTLSSLERAASALECRFVYALIPRDSLNHLIEERSRLTAANRLQKTQHSMRLEAQDVDETDKAEQLRRLAQRLVEKAGSELWDDDI